MTAMPTGKSVLVAYRAYDRRVVWISESNQREEAPLCYGSFRRITGVELKPGQTVRLKITAKRVKGKA
jgi:hypothetical protein